MFPQNSVYAKLFNDAILQFSASGLDLKIADDMAWDLQRSDAKQLLDTAGGRSFSMSEVEERKLNLADTEGMFLLMAIGYIAAGSVLFSEIVGGCAKSCRAFLRRGSVVSARIRRGSTFSLSQAQQERAKSFSEKLKNGIRRRLRPKAQPLEPENQIKPEEIKDEGMIEEPTESNEPELAAEPPLKGPASFCTLKRIMLMRKRRKAEKKAAKMLYQDSEMEIAREITDEKVLNCYENSINLEEGTVEGEQVTIENEKSSGIGDATSLIGSSSDCSNSHVIREETEAEVNHFSTSSDRENNPSTEFGEVV